MFFSSLTMARKFQIHLVFIELDMVKTHWARPDTRFVLVWMTCAYCRPLWFYHHGGVRYTRDEMTRFVESEGHYHVRLAPAEERIEPPSLVQDLEEADEEQETFAQV